MKRTTTIGKMYAVTSAAGCTVTTPDGLPICTVEAGTQGYFTAPTSTVEVDDDAALLTATFKRAASVFRLLGGGVDKWSKYAKCTTVADLQAVNADYKNDLTADGEWKWKLPKITDMTDAFRQDKALKLWKVNLPKVKNMKNAFIYANLEYVSCYAPLCTAWSDAFQENRKLREFHGDLSKATSLYDTFCYCENLRVFDTDLTSLQSGTGTLLATQLDKPSALRVFRTIPNITSKTPRLQIGIHQDFQADAELQEAIAEAESKSWTLEIQWNGKAGEYTASTASTWGRRKPVFARLGEPLEDGKQRLDWGHYVTDPSGYMEFASLEEAKEHFNITD